MNSYRTLEPRYGETIGATRRLVCRACISLVPGVEVLTIGHDRSGRCEVCGETLGQGECEYIRSEDAERVHRCLAERIAKAGRIRRMYADNVLIAPDWLRDKREERITAGGIILPKTNNPGDSEPVMATVIKAGPGWYDEPIRHNEGLPGHEPPKPSKRYVPMDPGLVPGARVLVDHAISGERYYIDGVEHRIVRAENIVGIDEEGVAAE